MIVYAIWTLMFLGISIQGAIWSSYTGVYIVRGQVYSYDVRVVIQTVTCYAME